jgi:hypothetical protein
VDRQHGQLMFGACRSAPLVAENGDSGGDPTAMSEVSLPKFCAADKSAPRRRTLL